MKNASSILHVAVPALALAFFVLHLAYLPQSLEDADSINFAIGLHAFDVANHQPHPPGYPIFIAAARGVRRFVGSDVRALALTSIIAGTLGVFAIGALFARWGEGLLALGLAITAPLYWFTANRPLSDMTGLAAAIAVQAMILSASTPRALVVAAFLAGCAVGLRSQVFWLTAPLLIVKGLGAGSWRLVHRVPSPKALATAISAYLVGVLLWAIPLVTLSGGPRSYWRALFNQGAEDFSGIRMLWTTPTLRELLDSMYFALVAPWATWPLAVLVITLAAIGAVVFWRRDRPTLISVVVAFAPYAIFDLLFQETFTSRYALPLVVPVALLAARGAAVVPANVGVIAAIGAAMFGAHVGGTSLAAYARQPAPAFRLFTDMQRATSIPVVVGMDRRQALDLLAPAKYLGGFPRNMTLLASPPQREALATAKYLTSDHRAPLWFVADPRRTDIDLIQHSDPQRYRWSLPYPVLIDGVRPDEMDWYELHSPEWWLDEGWALSPELAGLADASRSGPAFGAITGHLASAVRGGAIVFGGRNFDSSAHSRIDVRVDGQVVDTFEVPASAFVRVAHVPNVDGTTRAAELTINATPPSRMAIEQFDASASRVLMAFADGWHEQEFIPETGRRWRWLSGRGELRIVSPRPATALVLQLSGESPLKYFNKPSTVTVRADGAPVFSAAVSDDFSLTIPIARAAAVVTIETDQTYVPAERSWRTRDRRQLGLRIFTCEVRGVFAPDR